MARGLGVLRCYPMKITNEIHLSSEWLLYGGWTCICMICQVNFVFTIFHFTEGSQEFSRMKVKLQNTLASKALTDDLNDTLQVCAIDLYLLLCQLCIYNSLY